jgi:hypothetical protein
MKISQSFEFPFFCVVDSHSGLSISPLNNNIPPPPGSVNHRNKRLGVKQKPFLATVRASLLDNPDSVFRPPPKREL